MYVYVFRKEKRVNRFLQNYDDYNIWIFINSLCCITRIWQSAFLISSYGAPLAQRASYLALHSSLFGPVNCDYIVSNSINCLLIGSRCIPNGTHTKHCWANLAHASKHIKDSDNNLIIVYLTLHTSLLMNYKIKQVNSNDKRLKRKVKLVVAGVNFRATHWWLNPVALIVRAGSHLVVLAHWSEYLWL